MEFFKKLGFVFITVTMAIAADFENKDKWYNSATFDVGQWYSSPVKATDPMTGMDLKDVFKRKMLVAYKNLFDESGKITPEVAEELNAKIRLLLMDDQRNFPIFHAFPSAYAKNDMIRFLIIDLYEHSEHIDIDKNPEGFLAWLRE